MKIAAAVLSAFAAGVGAKKFAAKHASGLINKARKLNQDEEPVWLADYAVKFQGCHHIKQWNAEADGQEDVRLYTKRLVRFRLCPIDECSASDASGCQSGYGDYIVDMDLFLQQYWEATEQDKETTCENFMKQVCEPNCDGDDDEEGCEWNCAVSNGFEECIEGGDPNNDDEVEEIDYQEYLECKQLDVENNDDGVEYFSGPYCSEQGGAIKVGVFLDDMCTEFAGTSIYSLTGIEIPYEEKSLVDDECTHCVELEEWEEDDGNNDYDNQQEEEVEVRDMCAQVYNWAGKCETYLVDELGSGEINEQACNYMAGIKMVREDGMLDVSSARPSAVATAFIVIFAMAFAAMAFYVWYLRTRLGVKKNSLL